jgi:hypothetical protein
MIKKGQIRGLNAKTCQKAGLGGIRTPFLPQFVECKWGFGERGAPRVLRKGSNIIPLWGPTTKNPLTGIPCERGGDRISPPSGGP